MQTPSRLIPTAIVSIMLCWSATAGATMIDFDELEFTGGSASWLTNLVQVGDFTFSAAFGSDATLIAWQQSSSFYNGSAGLSISNSADILMTRTDGGIFDVSSLDVDNLFAGTAAGYAFQFIGSLAAGGEITQIFNPDGLLGNQTVQLIGFNNLTGLILSGTGPNGPGSVGFANLGSADNINTERSSVVAVPEAPTMALFALGLITLIASRRKQS